MALSRKHYTAIADVIRRNRDDAHLAVRPEHVPAYEDALEDLAVDLADFLAKDNPRFDRTRFLEASGAN